MAHTCATVLGHRETPSRVDRTSKPLSAYRVRLCLRVRAGALRAAGRLRAHTLDGARACACGRTPRKRPRYHPAPTPTRPAPTPLRRRASSAPMGACSRARDTGAQMRASASLGSARTSVTSLKAFLIAGHAERACVRPRGAMGRRVGAIPHGRSHRDSHPPPHPPRRLRRRRWHARIVGGPLRQAAPRRGARTSLFLKIPIFSRLSSVSIISKP